MSQLISDPTNQFLIVVTISIIGIILAAIIPIWIRRRDRKIAPPEITHLTTIIQAGRSVSYINLRTDESSKQTYGFPTTNNSAYREDSNGEPLCAPAVSFDISNAGMYEIHIDQVQICVKHFSDGELYLGRGETCGKFPYRGRCDIKKVLDDYPVSFLNIKPGEYINVEPGRTEKIYFHICAEDVAIYSLSVKVSWRCRSKSGVIEKEIEQWNLFYFDKEPESYFNPNTEYPF